MQRSYIFSIPTPCHESWDEMTLVEQGRFCQNCQKTVTDFSMMNDKELISFLSKTNSNICGRFHTEQLNREINTPVNTRRQPLLSIAAMTAALTVLTPSAQAKSKTEKIQLVSDRSNLPQPLDTLQHITGIVKDSTEDIRLPGVVVKIKGHNMQTVTDEFGKFELQIPAGIIENTVILEVQYIGYNTSDVVVPLISKAVNTDILLQPAIVPLSSLVRVGAISIVQGKRTSWQRFKHNVVQLFH